MAFDPMQEDCLRLILETMRRERVFPLENDAFIERCMEQFDADPAQLIVTDRDRSFHLTAQAAGSIDYIAPFITDDAEAEAEAVRAENRLREAIELNGDNWDAKRMLAGMEAESNDDYIDYLLAHRNEVERDLLSCMSAAGDVYSREYAGDLAHRPYLRWLAALSSRALIAGRYTLCLEAAEQALSHAPADPADVRFTAMLALAKLERPVGELKRFKRRRADPSQPRARYRRRHRPIERIPDAWAIISELCMAYHQLDLAAASRMLRALMRAYPNSAVPLFYQAEFPDGLFARVNVMPGGEDELILALSEATPLLEEGQGGPDGASLSIWLSSHELVQAELKKQGTRADLSGYPHSGEEN